jgi:hypothetical protein
MTDLDNQGGAEGVVETPVAPQPTPAEQQARDLGWTPEEEWDGPPESWLPHDEFLKKEGRTATKLKRSEAEVRALKAQQAEFNSRLENISRVARTTIERERQRIEREYEARIEEMTERGDVKGVKQALKDQKTELDKLEEKEDAPDGNAPPKAHVEAVQAFAAENPWFTQDQILNAAMNKFWTDVTKEMPAASFADTLAEAKRRVARKFPEEFGQKRSECAPNRVESGGRNLNGTGGGTYWSKLSAADKAQAEEDMKQYPKAYKSKEDWARVYFDVKD